MITDLNTGEEEKRKKQVNDKKIKELTIAFDALAKNVSNGAKPATSTNGEGM